MTIGLIGKREGSQLSQSQANLILRSIT